MPHRHATGQSDGCNSSVPFPRNVKLATKNNHQQAKEGKSRAAGQIPAMKKESNACCCSALFLHISLVFQPGNGVTHNAWACPPQLSQANPRGPAPK